jgi:hypothetical protein
MATLLDGLDARERSCAGEECAICEETFPADKMRDFLDARICVTCIKEHEQDGRDLGEDWSGDTIGIILE